MLVGLISDTHGQLRPEVFSHFDGVDRILHAGDIGSVGLLAELETLAPVTAVWGNTDGFDLRMHVREAATLTLKGWRVLVVHGHQLGSPKPESLLAAYPGPDIIVYGHTHRPVVHRAGRRMAINPGAAGPPRFRLSPSVALLELTPDEVDVRIIDLL